MREVAQLVAHHVRDVGVGRSSRLFSTKKDEPLTKERTVRPFFVMVMYAESPMNH